MRAGRRLGMELERREAVALKPFDGAVVQRDVADLRGVAGLDREAVVLGGHEHAPRAGHAHRMVRAAVSERKLERPQAEREPDELVAEADAEERRAAEQVADGLHRPVELGRISRAVADQHRRRLELQHGLRVPRPWDDHGLEARLDEPADDRVLAAEVEQDDPRTGADGVRLGYARLERGRRRGELRLGEHPRPVDVGLRERAGVQLLGRGAPERAAHGAVVAQTPHERSRVDLLERDDAPVCEPGRPGGPRAPHDDALRPHPARLEQPLVDAVVADEGRGEREHLARVARVGDRLLVAGGSGREARLARSHAGRADRAAGEHGSVFQDEMCALTRCCIVRIVYA